jgi:hypothetical protein
MRNLFCCFFKDKKTLEVILVGFSIYKLLSPSEREYLNTKFSVEHPNHIWVFRDTPEVRRIIKGSKKRNITYSF